MGVAFVDRDYPSRAAFSVVDKVLDDYSDHSRNAWRAATEDSSDALVVLDPAIVKYQVRRALALSGGPVCHYLEPLGIFLVVVQTGSRRLALRTLQGHRLCQARPLGSRRQMCSSCRRVAHKKAVCCCELRRSQVCCRDAYGVMLMRFLGAGAGPSTGRQAHQNPAGPG